MMIVDVSYINTVNKLYDRANGLCEICGVETPTVVHNRSSIIRPSLIDLMFICKNCDCFIRVEYRESVARGWWIRRDSPPYVYYRGHKSVLKADGKIYPFLVSSLNFIKGGKIV